MSEMDEMFDHILKSVEHGIFFDAMNFDYGQAYRNYADAINKSVEELSSFERQQAVLNAVLSAE